jgi:amino acid transporter
MQTLKRQVGLRTVISTGAGLALASISYVSLIEMSDHVSGNAGWMPLAVAGFICYLASLCFAELGGMFPSAAGIKLFIEKAFGESAALVLASLYIITTLSIVGAETYVLGSVLSYGFPGVPVLAWVIVFLLTISMINIRGVKLTGAFQDVVAYFKFVALITISWIALTKFHFPWDHPLQPMLDKTPLDFFQAVGVGVFLYLGFEWVTPLAEEVKDYRDIPKGMALSILLLFLAYGSLVTAMTSVGGKAELSAAVAAGKPIPHILFAVKAFGAPGVMIMMLMSLVASITCFNAGLLTASRFLYALARDNAAPKFLARIHERYLTPHYAIWSLFAVCTLLSFIVAYMGAFAECLIYVVMALSLIKLRRTHPNQERPFKVKTLAIPVLVAIFFFALGIGLLFENATAAISMGIVAIFTLAYVKFFVPRLKAQAVNGGRAPRRRRPSTGDSGAGDTANGAGNGARGSTGATGNAGGASVTDITPTADPGKKDDQAS